MRRYFSSRRRVSEPSPESTEPRFHWRTRVNSLMNEDIKPPSVSRRTSQTAPLPIYKTHDSQKGDMADKPRLRFEHSDRTESRTVDIKSPRSRLGFENQAADKSIEERRRERFIRTKSDSHLKMRVRFSKPEYFETSKSLDAADENNDASHSQWSSSRLRRARSENNSGSGSPYRSEGDDVSEDSDDPDRDCLGACAVSFDSGLDLRGSISPEPDDGDLMNEYIRREIREAENEIGHLVNDASFQGQARRSNSNDDSLRFQQQPVPPMMASLQGRGAIPKSTPPQSDNLDSGAKRAHYTNPIGSFSDADDINDKVGGDTFQERKRREHEHFRRDIRRKSDADPMEDEKDYFRDPSPPTEPLPLSQYSHSPAELHGMYDGFASHPPKESTPPQQRPGFGFFFDHIDGIEDIIEKIISEEEEAATANVGTEGPGSTFAENRLQNKSPLLTGQSPLTRNDVLGEDAAELRRNTAECHQDATYCGGNFDEKADETDETNKDNNDDNDDADNNNDNNAAYNDDDNNNNDNNTNNDDDIGGNNDNSNHEDDIDGNNDDEDDNDNEDDTCNKLPEARQIRHFIRRRQNTISNQDTTGDDDDGGDEDSWSCVPKILLEDIFTLLTPKDRHQTSQVCKHWYDLFYSPRVWETFILLERTLTKKRFNLYKGYQRELCPWKTQLCLRRVGSFFKRIVITPISDYFNLFEFLRVLAAFLQYQEEHGQKAMPLLHTFDFTFACATRGDDGVMVHGTGGQVLDMIIKLIVEMSGLKHLKLNQLLTDVAEVQDLLGALTGCFSESLNSLEMLNVTKVPFGLSELSQFRNLLKLTISPQHLNEEVLVLLAGLNLVHLHLTQDIYTCQCEAVSWEAWRLLKEMAPWMRVYLEVSGTTRSPLLIQPRAPVHGVFLRTPYSRLNNDLLTDLVEQYGKTLRYLVQEKLPRVHGPRNFDKRCDSSLLFLVRRCPHLHTLVVSERLSTATLLLVANEAKNLSTLLVRQNALIKRCDWPSRGEWSREFYNRVKTCALDYDKCANEICTIVRHRWLPLSDKQFMRLKIVPKVDMF